jgi:hypothetical protein
MGRRSQIKKESIPPTMTAEQAIESIPTARPLSVSFITPRRTFRNPRGMEADLANLSTKDLHVIATIAL